MNEMSKDQVGDLSWAEKLEPYAHEILQQYYSVSV